MPSHTEEPFSLRFLNACKIHALRPAIIDWKKGVQRTILYEQLLQDVYRQMAFIQKEIPEELVIAVADQQDTHTYASFLALNLLGKTWVPVSIKNPESRNLHILNEAGCNTVLSSEAFSLQGFRVLKTNSLPADAEIIPAVNASAQPAYILFTSGSTGTPKGVPVFNIQLHAFFDFFMESGPYRFQPSDRFLQVYEAGFDVSVFVAFSALFTGASLYMMPGRQFLFHEIPFMLDKADITVISMVPTVLHYWKPYFKSMRFEKLRYSFFSGDKLLHSLAEQWNSCIPNAEIINSYGPTETTIVCSHYLWNKEQSQEESLNGVVPLGRLFPGMHSLMKEEDGAFSETEGELCLAGPQVIPYYLQQASPEKFFRHEGLHFFCTGDRVVKLQSGIFQFVGRTDFQVKINGYRVEPGETEAALTALNSEALCAVLAVQEENGLYVLHAFAEGTGEEQTLIGELKKVLPAQSVPRSIHFVNPFPLNSNGKPDRAELLKFVR
ncbi:MAG: AMP-binding protein [Bacteroidia bacterium]